MALLSGRTALFYRLSSASLVSSYGEIALNEISGSSNMIDYVNLTNQTGVSVLQKMSVPLLPAPARPFATIALDSYQHSSTYLFNEASKNHGK